MCRRATCASGATALCEVAHFSRAHLAVKPRGWPTGQHHLPSRPLSGAAPHALARRFALYRKGGPPSEAALAAVMHLVTRVLPRSTPASMNHTVCRCTYLSHAHHEPPTYSNTLTVVSVSRVIPPSPAEALPPRCPPCFCPYHRHICNLPTRLLCLDRPLGSLVGRVRALLRNH